METRLRSSLQSRRFQDGQPKSGMRSLGAGQLGQSIALALLPLFGAELAKLGARRRILEAGVVGGD